MCFCKCIAIELTFKYYIVVNSTTAFVVVTLLHFGLFCFGTALNCHFNQAEMSQLDCVIFPRRQQEEDPFGEFLNGWHILSSFRDKMYYKFSGITQKLTGSGPAVAYNPQVSQRIGALLPR